MPLVRRKRPVLTIDQVLRLADEMRDRRFRALVLLATFANLRWGEAIALRRVDIDTERCIVRVRVAYVERSTGPLLLGPPKSRAGRRTIRYPTAIADDIRQHLDTYTGPGPHDLMFTGAKGRPLRRSTFQRYAGGTMPLTRLVRLAFTFMICATPGTRWQHRPVRVSPT